MKRQPVDEYCKDIAPGEGPVIIRWGASIITKVFGRAWEQSKGGEHTPKKAWPWGPIVATASDCSDSEPPCSSSGHHCRSLDTYSAPKCDPRHHNDCHSPSMSSIKWAGDIPIIYWLYLVTCHRPNQEHIRLEKYLPVIQQHCLRSRQPDAA